MIIKIDGDLLASFLQKATQIIAKNSTMQILACVMFKVDKDRLTIYSTNLEQSLIINSLSFNNVNQQTGIFVIFTESLFKVVKVLKGEINLLIEKEKLIISNDKARYEIPLIPHEDFPNINIFETEYMGLDGNIISTHLQQLKPCTSNEDHRYYLQGIHFKYDEEGLSLTASDGRRLAITNTPVRENIIKECNWIIPKKAIDCLIDCISEYEGQNTIKMGYNNGKAIFIISDFTIITSLIDGVYPDTSAIVEAEYKDYYDINVKDLLELVELASVGLDKKHTMIELSISNQGIKAHSQSNNDIISDAQLSLELESEPIRFGVNYSFMKECLKLITTNNVQLALIDNKKAIRLTDSNTNVYYFIMPMKLEDEE